MSRMSSNRKADSTYTVLNAIGESSSGALKYFGEALDNKSIVLKNTNAQLRASKSSTRAKSNAARIGKMSKRGLKKKGSKLIPNDPKEYRVSERDVRRTHHLWKQFVTTVLKSCTHELQVQAKLYETGLLGAHVTLLEGSGGVEVAMDDKTESRRRRRRLSGFVINESKNCMFLAILHEEAGHGDDKSGGVVVKRVLKAPNMFAVSLPTTSASTKGRFMILHGKQFLPLKNGKSFGS